MKRAGTNGYHGRGRQKKATSRDFREVLPEIGSTALESHRERIPVPLALLLTFLVRPLQRSVKTSPRSHVNITVIARGSVPSGMKRTEPSQNDTVAPL